MTAKAETNFKISEKGIIIDRFKEEGGGGGGGGRRRRRREVVNLLKATAEGIWCNQAIFKWPGTLILIRSSFAA